MLIFRLFFALGLLGSATLGQEATKKPSDPAPKAKPYDQHVRPFLAKHCQECHGADKPKPKGNFRLDQLDPDFKAATLPSGHFWTPGLVLRHDAASGRHLRVYLQAYNGLVSYDHYTDDSVTSVA